MPTTPVCDCLVLAFSEGVSLKAWEDGGLLEREWALYERVRAAVGRIVLVTYGGERDTEIAARLGPGVSLVCNGGGLSDGDYFSAIPTLTHAAVGEARRVIVKTNQMTGGDAALRIVAALRESGRDPALVARGGYLWSQFAAGEHGADSTAARQAGEREGCLCRGADVVVGTTRQMVADLAWRHGLAESSLAVIPNYVLGGAGRGTGSRDDTTILFAGRLEKQKRVDRLIEALGHVAEPLRGRASLSIIGAGTLEKQLRDFADELGVNVTFEGRLPHAELLDRMSRCAVYAQTSAYEGHPKTVLEAMACSAPVLVVDEPGLRGVVRHGISGICVPPDARAIAMGLEAMLRDAPWRAAMGAAAAEQVRAECSLDRVVGLELEVYGRALAAAAASHRDGGAGESARTPR